MRSSHHDQRRSRPEPRPRPWRTWPAAIALAVLLFALAGPAAGDDPAPQPEPILAAARSAVAQNRVVRSRVLGFFDKQRTFTELPKEGAVLIGFELGLGKFFDIEIVYALRAIYRTPKGDMVSTEHGLFADKRLANGRLLKSRVLRTVRVRAPSGYAVGGITLRSGLCINGLSLTYMRIDGKRLDPRRAFQSTWVGDRTGGSERSLDCGGAPVVGLFGSQAEDHVNALALVFIKP
jgi:hypothetical protein